MRTIFENRAVPLYKHFFQKTFVQYVTILFVLMWTYKNADEKEYTFLWKRKLLQKRTKVEKRILCKFTFKKKTDTL